MRIEGVRTVKIGGTQFLNAPAAASLGGFGHKDGVAGEKVHDLLCVFPGDGDPVPAEEGGEFGVEPDLVAQLVKIGFVVVPDHQLVVAAPGQIGVPLFGGEIIHLEQVVVHIARAVLHRAVLHIPENGQAGTPGFPVDGVDFFQHCPVIHIQDPLDEVFQICHGAPPRQDDLSFPRIPQFNPKGKAA